MESRRWSSGYDNGLPSVQLKQTQRKESRLPGFKSRPAHFALAKWGGRCQKLLAISLNRLAHIPKEAKPLGHKKQRNFPKFLVPEMHCISRNL